MGERAPQEWSQGYALVLSGAGARHIGVTSSLALSLLSSTLATLLGVENVIQEFNKFPIFKLI